jgi:hypothetical protein
MQVVKWFKGHTSAEWKTERTTFEIYKHDAGTAAD